MFILHPGFLNCEAGPDFRNALIQVGDGPPRVGDVEVDPRPADWRQHGHHANANYRNVLLQVVWRRPSSGGRPPDLPILELEPVLDAPIDELRRWLEQPGPPELPAAVRGKCAGPLSQLAPQQLEGLIQQASLFRLHSRAARFRTRARAAGWSQAFWEGAFRALGYKHNTWPMLRLAELRPRWSDGHTSRIALLARLLGVSGLLPGELRTRRGATPLYARQLWDVWWRERDAFADCTLPPLAWRRSGGRPINHPQRRLALVAHWIHQGDLPDRLMHWCRETPPDARLADSLLRVLRPAADPFWSRHYTMLSPVTPKPLPLLGGDRVTDLAANVVLPWLWSRAQQGRRTAVCREIERRYLCWPAGSDNVVLKRARQRLFNGVPTALSRRMATQQGLLQILGDHCDQSNSLCEGCRFPGMAHRFGQL